MPLTLKITGMEKNRCMKAVQDGKNLQVSYRGDYLTIDINPYGSPVAVSYMKEKKRLKEKRCALLEIVMCITMVVRFQRLGIINWQQSMA